MQTENGRQGKVFVAFHAPHELVDQVDREAKAECLSRAAVIRRILLQHFREHPLARQAYPIPPAA
jgi:hypothetical protein